MTVYDRDTTPESAAPLTPLLQDCGLVGTSGLSEEKLRTHAGD
jgi:hypothetical protein